MSSSDAGKFDEVDFFLGDALIDDPYPYFDFLRAQCPVTREPHHDVVMVTGYEDMWKQIVDPQGFYAPFGPTTAEQRHPQFSVVYRGHECQWNGPSWPYSTAVTLVVATAVSRMGHAKSMGVAPLGKDLTSPLGVKT